MGKKIKNQKSKIKNLISKKNTSLHLTLDIGSEVASGDRDRLLDRRGSIGYFRLGWEGFTLVEIILTVSIMSILSLFGAATYREYNQNRAMDIAIGEVANIMELAKTRAQSQVKPDVTSCDDVPSAEPLYGYRVRICPGTCTTRQEYELQVVCGTTGQNSTKISSYVLPSGVTFASSQQQDVLFRVLTGQVEGVSNIDISGYERSREINISSTGVLSIAYTNPTPLPSAIPTPTYSGPTLTPTTAPPTNTPTTAPPTSTPTTAPPTSTPTTAPPTPTPTPVVVAVDSISDSGPSVAASTDSWTHTVSGTDRLLIVGVVTEMNRTVTVTWKGSETFDQLAETGGSGNQYAEMFYLKNPSTGTGTIQVTISSSDNLRAGAISLTGVNQTITFGTYKTVSSSGTTVTTPTITSATNELIVDVAAVANYSGLSTPGSGQTEIWDTISGGGTDPSGAGSYKTGASSTTTSWGGWGGSKTATIIAVPVKPAS